VKFEWGYLHQGAKYVWGRPYRKNLRLLGIHSRKRYEIVSMKGDCAPPSRTVILPMTLNYLNHPKSPLLLWFESCFGSYFILLELLKLVLKFCMQICHIVIYAVATSSISLVMTNYPQSWRDPFLNFVVLLHVMHVFGTIETRHLLWVLTVVTTS